MAAPRKRKTRLIIAVGVIVGICLAAGLALMLFNPTLTRYIEGPAFRAELEKQTAKGLHFPSSQFAPIRRTGFLSATSESFQAQDGRKAMTSFDAHGITARFNPLGVFLRRWQLDELHIDHGEVGIQIYEPKPEPTPAKPWYHVFLPDRVYLKRVWSEPADVTWRMRGEDGGILGTRLVITPHGRDFEYRATGGTLKNAPIPDLEFRRTHLLITKEEFTLYELELASGSGAIQGEGMAETRGEKRVDFNLKWNEVPVRAWLPKSWTGNFGGAAAGHLRWTGRDFKMETAQVQGTLRVNGAKVSELKFLEQIAAVTKRADFARLDLSECTAEFAFDQGNAELKNIALEDKGKFRLEGVISVKKQSLDGELELGVNRTHLAWLPNPEEVFPREKDGYLWTTVHLSGTLESPQQDLSPRILEALDDSPGAFWGAALRALGAWLRGE